MRRHCDQSGHDFELGQSTSGLLGSEGPSAHVPAGVYREGTLGPQTGTAKLSGAVFGKEEGMGV